MDYIDATNDVIIEKEKPYIPDCPECGKPTHIVWRSFKEVKDGHSKGRVDCPKCKKVFVHLYGKYERAKVLSIVIEKWREKNK